MEKRGVIMNRSLEISLTDTMGHLDFITQYFGRDIPSIALAILIELNIPSPYMGFVYLLNAIELFCRDPFAAALDGIYSQIADAYGGKVTEEQIEQAIRRAIKKGWNKRRSSVWKYYFSTSDDGIMTMPTSQEFISRIGYLLILYTGHGERIRIYEEI